MPGIEKIATHRCKIGGMKRDNTHKIPSVTVKFTLDATVRKTEEIAVKCYALEAAKISCHFEITGSSFTKYLPFCLFV